MVPILQILGSFSFSFTWSMAIDKQNSNIFQFIFPALAESCYIILHAQETCQLETVPAVSQQEECLCSLNVLFRVNLASQGGSPKLVDEKSKYSRWKPAVGSKKGNFSNNSPLFLLLCYLSWIFFPFIACNHGVQIGLSLAYTPYWWSFDFRESKVKQLTLFPECVKTD